MVCVNSDKPWQFKPCNFSEGQTITGGSIFGTVFENELMPVHSIMLPPDLYGTVVRTYGDGTDGKESFTLNDTVRGGCVLVAVVCLWLFVWVDWAVGVGCRTLVPVV